MSKKNPYGDDAGTRIGRPSEPQREQKETEAGNEAARGIHSNSGGKSSNRPGSEPMKDRENEHRSGYGGDGGKPKR